MAGLRNSGSGYVQRNSPPGALRMRANAPPPAAGSPRPRAAGGSFHSRSQNWHLNANWTAAPLGHNRDSHVVRALTLRLALGLGHRVRNRRRAGGARGR